MTTKKKPFALMCVAYCMLEGGVLASVSWLVAGPNPWAIALGGAIGIGCGIITALEQE